MFQSIAWILLALIVGLAVGFFVGSGATYSYLAEMAGRRKHKSDDGPITRANKDLDYVQEFIRDARDRRDKESDGLHQHHEDLRQRVRREQEEVNDALEH